MNLWLCSLVHTHTHTTSWMRCRAVVATREKRAPCEKQAVLALFPSPYGFPPYKPYLSSD